MFAVVSGHPDSVNGKPHIPLPVLCDGQHLSVRQTIGGGEVGEALADILSAIEATHSVVGSEPQMSLAILQYRTNVVVYQTVGGGEVGETLPIEAAHSSVGVRATCADPQVSPGVLGQRQHPVVQESIPGGIGDELPAIVPGQTLCRSEPHIPLTILEHGRHCIRSQPISESIGDEPPAIVSTHSASPGRQPQIPFPILENIGHGWVRQAVLYIQGLPRPLPDALARFYSAPLAGLYLPTGSGFFHYSARLHYQVIHLNRTSLPDFGADISCFFEPYFRFDPVTSRRHLHRIVSPPVGPRLKPKGVRRQRA